MRRTSSVEQPTSNVQGAGERRALTEGVTEAELRQMRRDLATMRALPFLPSHPEAMRLRQSLVDGLAVRIMVEESGGWCSRCAVRGGGLAR